MSQLARDGRSNQPIQAKDLVGFKYFGKVLTLLERLHDQACARDTAGNRVLHYDQHIALTLLYLFNPIVSSLLARKGATAHFITKGHQRGHSSFFISSGPFVCSRQAAVVAVVVVLGQRVMEARAHILGEGDAGSGEVAVDRLVVIGPIDAVVALEVVVCVASSSQLATASSPLTTNVGGGL